MATKQVEFTVTFPNGLKMSATGGARYSPLTITLMDKGGKAAAGAALKHGDQVLGTTNDEGVIELPSANLAVAMTAIGELDKKMRPPLWRPPAQHPDAQHPI